MATSAPAAQPPRRHAATLARREAITAYLFIAPYLITAGIFTFGVLAYVFYTSFTNLSASFAAANAKFVGLDNYIRAFQDQEFRISLANVFWYFVVVTTLLSDRVKLIEEENAGLSARVVEQRAKARIRFA